MTPEIIFKSLDSAVLMRRCVRCGGELKIQRMGINVFHRCVRCKALTTIYI
ncbi:MAG: hypothetical protein QXJ68_05480 [Methanocellales archaeon]